MSLVVLAQVGDAGVVAEGLAKNPLAWGCVILLLTCGWLARTLLASYEARLNDLQTYNDRTMSTLTSVITLGLKQTEATDVLDKALDRFTQPQREE